MSEPGSRPSGVEEIGTAAWRKRRKGSWERVAVLATRSRDIYWFETASGYVYRLRKGYGRSELDTLVAMGKLSFDERLLASLSDSTVAVPRSVSGENHPTHGETEQAELHERMLESAREAFVVGRGWPETDGRDGHPCLRLEIQIWDAENSDWDDGSFYAYLTASPGFFDTAPNLHVSIRTLDESVFEDGDLLWLTRRLDFEYDFDAPIWEVLAQQYNWESSESDYYRFLIAAHDETALAPVEDFITLYRDPLEEAMAPEELAKAPPPVDAESVWPPFD